RLPPPRRLAQTSLCSSNDSLMPEAARVLSVLSPDVLSPLLSPCDDAGPVSKVVLLPAPGCESEAAGFALAAGVPPSSAEAPLAHSRIERSSSAAVAGRLSAARKRHEPRRPM